MDAIPKHCFKRSLVMGMLHVISDLSLAGVLFYASLFFGHPVLPSWAKYVLWPVYWYAQGAVLTGVWVLAHECGHQSFSESELANNIVGTILHSFLLVPYHSWRITHGLHHNNTGSCENDEVFAPQTRSDFTVDMIEETPILSALGIIRMLAIGWIPGYLVFNATGPAKYRGKNANHFSPYAVFFKPEDRAGVSQSVAAWFAAVAIMAYFVYTYGATAVLLHYFLPYMVVNYHLVLITFLQHTDTFVPHFRGQEWTWLRGALCTVDRSFGPVLDHCFHHIADTHVCHHLFSKMPFYHAQEATEHVRRVLGNYYLKDETTIARALWR
jgi:omega-6 fatty acid desaturase (delta-12 desaturase)